MSNLQIYFAVNSFFKTIIVSAAFLLTVTPVTSGEALHLSLDEAVARARANSVDAAVALNRLRTAYWKYRTFRADLLPEISFNATIPGYRKQYSPYQESDGTYSFVRNNYLEMNGEISVTQNIWFTGGQLSLNTSLDFIRQLDGDRYNRFMSIPVALTLNQPLFSVNTIKWDRRIEPVRYTEAKAEFISATEDVACQAVNYFFNLLMAIENRDIARQNLEISTRLHEVAIEKRRMGRISENDLLQMELNELSARSSLTDCESELNASRFQLQAFLGYEGDVEIIPDLPAVLPECDVVYDRALAKALELNKFSSNLMRRRLEAEYEVAKAKGNMRRIDLFAQIGFTGTGNRIGSAYDPLKDNQVVEVGIKIPVLDWGKRRGQVKVARSNREVVESQVRKETMDFKQNLFVLVERFNNQQKQLRIALRSDTIASRRYATNVETFLIGKISTLDLNDSQVTKDQARRDYINELYLYWNYYYSLRSVTLWDFVENRSIDADIEAVLRQ